MCERIGFIGAGKVGTAFGRYLKDKGEYVSGYYNRTLKNAQYAADFTNSSIFETMKLLIDSSEIIFITTTDTSISKVADIIVKENICVGEKLFVHMSGTLSSEVLGKLKKQGAYIFSLHPIQAFADIEKSVSQLENTVFGLEGDKEKIDILIKLLCRIKNEYFILKTDQKVLYHTAACVISNFLVTLIDYGLDIYKSIGIDQDKALKAVTPLIESTIKNIGILGTKQALTGPIDRGDFATVKAHMQALNKKDFEIYIMLALKTAELADKKNNTDNKFLIEMNKTIAGISRDD